MPNAIADGLRRCGLDVTTSGDLELLGASEDVRLAYATREKRLLITRDQDLLRLHARDRAGIIYWTERHRTVGQLIGALATLTVDYSDEDLQGRVLYL